ncbi:uncharacterized protein MELLADRAFT_77162 [Melampsora larici-populina 98AG31]|uniref:Septation initiation network scaffold protein cdc11 n=1 Tax=Melampsora larici-populina (strain 98AG31 / pathotype 3-4-7) TaxID=747676 RepID=F4RE45_MELLP|nr:uncharacterized protein MELLADRAFT_77162 [Melampsora larici-populina 98AG31]EGG09029.1 hypothetical protein MELLADRAFT_77162 [Melampsora larici-populina 98AG31]
MFPLVNRESPDSFPDPHHPPRIQINHHRVAEDADLASCKLAKETFQFAVPRSNTSWKSLRHFSASDVSSEESSGRSSIVEREEPPAAEFFEPAAQHQYYRRPTRLGDIEVIEEVSEEPSLQSDSGREYASGSLPSSTHPPSIPFAHPTPLLRHPTNGRMEQPDSSSSQSDSCETSNSIRPPPSSSAQSQRQTSQPTPDPQDHEQRIFHFTYDTFARKHLSRLVEEIDGFSSGSLLHDGSPKIHALIGSPGEVPSSNVSRSSRGLAHSTPPTTSLYAGRTPFRPLQLPTYSQRVREEAAWHASFLEPNAYAAESLCGPGHHFLDADNDDEKSTSFDRQAQFAATAPARSSKRIRLLSSLPSSTHLHVAPSLNTSRLKDSVIIASERKTKRHLPTDVHNPTMGMPSVTDAEQQPATRDRLAEARALMDRIRAKNILPPPVTTTQKSDHVDSSSSLADDSQSHHQFETPMNSRPRNPTPHAASSIPRQWISSPESQEDWAGDIEENETQSCEQAGEGIEDLVGKSQDDQVSDSIVEHDDERLIAEEDEDFAWTIVSDTSAKGMKDPAQIHPKQVEERDEADSIHDECSSTRIRSCGSSTSESFVQQSPSLDAVHERLASTAAASLRQALLDSAHPASRPSAGVHQSRRSPLGSGRSVASFAAPGSATRRHFATQPIPCHELVTDAKVGMNIGKSAHMLSSLRARPVGSFDRHTSGTGSTYTLSSTTTNTNQAHKPILMTIGPADVEDLLQQERVGGMIFDATQKRWRRCGVEKQPVEGKRSEDVGSEAEEEEEDVFKDIESLNSRGLTDDQVSRRQEEDEADGRCKEDNHQREPTTTDGGMFDAAVQHNEPRTACSNFKVAQHLPFVDNHSTPATTTRPKSALKSRLGATRAPSPIPNEEVVIEHSTRPNRSVSFQDGRKNGKIIGLVDQPRLVHDPDGTTDQDAFKSIATTADEISTRTRRIGAALDELIGVGGMKPGDTSMISLGSTTKKVRPKNGQRKVSSGSSGGGGQAERTFLTDCSFGMSREKLLKLITDIEPYEPMWDQLKVVDLSGKRIESVVKLDEFLPKLDQVDLLSLLVYSHVRSSEHSNQLGFLTGLPGTIRMLLVNENRLTDLVSFGHLLNLERLDLSKNGLTSLEQISGLKHLRELKVDDNEIVSLEGLAALDGLTKLSVKGNKLKNVHLEGFAWPRLEVLNLSRNQIREISGLEGLHSMYSLNLDHNDLYTLSAPQQSMLGLRVLRISDNHIESVDISAFTNLRTIYVDHNDLIEIKGAERLRKLENLSARDQHGGELSLPMKQFRDVKRLYLGGNPIPSAFPSQRFYNLVYLELAMCQCKTLPSDLAKVMPNVRSVNLNYNFLTDLDALVGLTRLQKLTVVGSRLKEFGRRLIKVLESLPELELLDLRTNPFCSSFYAPLLAELGTNKSPHLNQYEIIASSANSSTPCMPKSQQWNSMDERFRKALPNEYYLKRTTYRALVIGTNLKLKVLDGLYIDEPERKKMGKFLRGLGRKIESSNHNHPKKVENNESQIQGIEKVEEKSCVGFSSLIASANARD